MWGCWVRSRGEQRLRLSFERKFYVEVVSDPVWEVGGVRWIYGSEGRAVGLIGSLMKDMSAGRDKEESEGFFIGDNWYGSICCDWFVGYIYLIVRFLILMEKLFVRGCYIISFIIILAIF